LDVYKLRALVRTEYDRLAREPDQLHLPHGPRYASRVLRYDAQELARLPHESTFFFAGVGNPQSIGAIAAGEAVVDVGCGAGMDLLLAARRTGPTGRLIGVDMTPMMVELAKRAALKAGLWQQIEIRCGLAEDLPVDSNAADLVISNGVLNLSIDKARCFREIYRVLRPGGRLYLADIVLQRELSVALRSEAGLWLAGLGGALMEAELSQIAEKAGFIEGSIVDRFDCRHGKSAEAKWPKNLHAHGVNYSARKPGSGAPRSVSTLSGRVP
jgi:SAM-dependent methyltransferase